MRARLSSAHDGASFAYAHSQEKSNSALTALGHLVPVSEERWTELSDLPDEAIDRLGDALIGASPNHRGGKEVQEPPEPEMGVGAPSRAPGLKRRLVIGSGSRPRS